MIQFRERHAEREYCSIAAAIIGGVTTTIGAVAQAGAASSAAKSQQKNDQAAIAEQDKMFNTVRGDLLPYNTGGQADFSRMNALLTGSPAQQEAALQGLPGYQFALTQGLKSVQNSASARGLGVSGAALKGAASYATGLADQTYGSQINRLYQGAALGEQAAAQTGQFGTSTAQSIAQAQIGIGQAQAGGQIGVGNAISGAAQGIGNNLMLANYFGGGMFGGGQTAAGMAAAQGIPAGIIG